MNETSVTSKFKFWQWKIFAVLWVTYGAFYLCRVNLSIALPDIMKEFNCCKAEVGAIASAMFIAYAIGQFINGQLTDRFGARKLVTLGIFVSVLMNIIFGFSTVLNVMMILWFVNGYFQAMGWPGVIKTMANWFPIKTRGKISGLFGSCYQIGNALSWLLAGYLTSHYGWRTAFWVPAIIFAGVGVMFYISSRNTPESICLPSIEEYEAQKESNTTTTEVKCAAKEEYLGFKYTLKQTVGNPKVWLVGLSFMCLDVIRYGFLLWAPTYMFEQQGATISQAAWKAVALPLAGTLGAITAGWLTDKFFGSRRAPVIAIMLTFLGIFSLIYPKIPAHNWILSMVCLLVIGFMTYGPHVLMVGTVAMDFGTRKGAASAAGFIDALGYVGATLTGVGTGWLIDHYGWNSAFYFWVIAAFLGAILSAVLWKYKPEQGKYM